jgi:tripartite-type tricarboxylate transporter receptor subunit TctC
MRGAKTPVNALAIGMLAFAGPAYAQDWPARPVTMIVPFAAGGPVDARPHPGAVSREVIGGKSS